MRSVLPLAIFLAYSQAKAIDIYSLHTVAGHALQAEYGHSSATMSGQGSVQGEELRYKLLGSREVDRASPDWNPTVRRPMVYRLGSAESPAVAKTGACMLQIVKSSPAYSVAALQSYVDLLKTRANASLLSTGLWDTADTRSDSLNLPVMVQSALIDHEIVRRAPDIRLSLVPAPEVDDNGLVPAKLGGRLLSWYKISIVQKLLHDWKSMAPGSKPCKYIAWIEDDAFLTQPDLDYAASFASLPLWVRPQYEPPSMSAPAAPSLKGASSADATTARATSLTEVAMAAAVERVVPGILEANEARCTGMSDCRFNVGVLLFNAEHPKLPALLEDWWRAPLTGVCDPSMATKGGAEQACLDALIEWNATTRAQYRHVVGEADLLTINTPAGRLVRQDWDNYRANMSHPDAFRERMTMIGLWNHTVARQLLSELPALVMNVPFVDPPKEALVAPAAADPQMNASPEAQLKSQPATASSAGMENARDVSAGLANLSRANLRANLLKSQPATQELTQEGRLS